MNIHLFNKDYVFPEKATFIWAPPSHGNVGQIAVDAIASKYRKQCSYIGCIESMLVMPLSGYCDVTGSKILCKPIEMYELQRAGPVGGSVFIIQQRSPCLRGMAERFCKELSALMYGPSVDCELLVVATGASTASMLDEAVLGNRIFALASDSPVVLSSSVVTDSVNLALGSLSSPVNKLQSAAVHSAAIDAGAFDSMYDVDRQNGNKGPEKALYPHGMMLARIFVESTALVAGGMSKQVVCIGRYCSEGAGNVIDGQVIAETLVQMLHVC